MATITVNGVDLYYEVYGVGMPILGIHGTPSTAAFWTDAAETLATHGRCVIYDRRGFHRSAPAPATLDLADHVEDAIALLDALSASPAVVIGRSTGGLIALELARRHPEVVRAVALLEPALFTVDSRAAQWAAQLRTRILAVDESKASEAVVREALGDDVWQSLPEPIRVLFADAGPAVLAEIRGEGLDLSEHPLVLTPAELEAVAMPVLLVSGEDSPEPLRVVAQRLATLLPGAESVQVAGGHLIDPAHPAVLDFLARNGTGPR